MTEFASLSATEAAQAIADGEISSRELTTALLDRIEAMNPALNAVVEVRRGEALGAADAADKARVAGAPMGPLHGVPMTVKESFDVAGLRTTWGNPAFAEFRAGRDATVVRRLERAGAIVVGKTNVAFMLADFAQTDNPVYGATRNPWDTDRTPGSVTSGGWVGEEGRHGNSASASCSTTRPPRSPARWSRCSRQSSMRCPTPGRRSSRAGRPMSTRCARTSRSGSTSDCSSPSPTLRSRTIGSLNSPPRSSYA